MLSLNIQIQTAKELSLIIDEHVNGPKASTFTSFMRARLVYSSTLARLNAIIVSVSYFLATRCYKYNVNRSQEKRLQLQHGF